jgi:choline dehydrogenase
MGLPEINFRYHAEDNPRGPGDSQPVVTGVKAARDVIRSYSSLVAREVWPGAEAQGDAALREAIESNSWGHHANGTARMGRDAGAGDVVDRDLKVIGARGIRVSDASVFRHTPGSFIVTAVVQIGEAAAIKAIAEASGQDPRAVMDEIIRQA